MIMNDGSQRAQQCSPETVHPVALVDPLDDANPVLSTQAWWKPPKTLIHAILQPPRRPVY